MSINRHSAISLDEAKKLQADSLKRISEFIEHIKEFQTQLQEIKNVLPLDEKSKQECENLEKNINTAYSNLTGQQMIVNQADITKLTKPKNFTRGTKIYGTNVTRSTSSPASKVHRQLGKAVLFQNVKPLAESFQAIGKLLLKEFSALQHTDKGPQLKKKEADLQRLYDRTGNSFIKFAALIDENYNKNIEDAKQISTLLAKTHNNLEQLKQRAELNGDNVTIDTYDYLQTLMTYLFVSSIYKEDLEATKNVYLETIEKLQPEQKLSKLIEEFKEATLSSFRRLGDKNITTTKKDLIEEIQKLREKFNSEKQKCEKLKESKPEFQALYSHFVNAVDRLDRLEEAVNLSSKTSEHKQMEIFAKIDAILSPKNSPSDTLAQECEANINALSKKLNEMKESMDSYVKRWGIENALPIVRHLALMIVPVLSPVLSSGIGSAHRLIDPVTSTVQNTIDQVPVSDHIKVETIRAAETQLAKTVENQLTQKPADTKIEPQGLEAQVTSMHPGWHTDFLEQLENKAKSAGRSAVISGVTFALCMAFPPAAPTIALTSLAISLTDSLYQNVKRDSKTNESMQEKISTLASLEQLTEETRMMYSHLSYDKQTTLFQASLLLEFTDLPIDARKALLELTTNLLDPTQSLTEAEKPKGSTAKITGSLQIPLKLEDSKTQTIESKEKPTEDRELKDHAKTIEKESSQEPSTKLDEPSGVHFTR